MHRHKLKEVGMYFIEKVSLAVAFGSFYWLLEAVKDFW